MKRIKNILPFAVLCAMLCSCELFQSSLSSVQNSKLNEETGTATYESNIWTYFGTVGNNMAARVLYASDDYQAHSLKIDFGKQVALSKLSGSITINYSDAGNNSSTKTFTNLDGRFSDDYKSFFLDMKDVLSLFDTDTIPSGTAVAEIKVQGFVCAEGEQNGRSIPAFTAKLPVRPLFNTFETDLSTCWFKAGDKVELPLNGKIILENKEKVFDSTGTYSFVPSFNEEENILELECQENLKGVTVMGLNILLSGVRPYGSGEAYDTELTLNLVNSAIIIDGRKDSNYSSENALVVKDAEGDQEAFGYNTMGDIKEVSLVNDDENLYIGVSGDLSINWKDSLVIMLSKGSSAGTNAVMEISPADSFTTITKNGRVNVFIYHKPGNENNGKGAWGANAEGVDITNQLKLSPEGWTEKTNGDFLEYSLPLSSIGFSKGETVKVTVVMSLDWSEGKMICDAVPDAVVVKKEYDAENSAGSVRMDFANAVSYTIR